MATVVAPRSPSYAAETAPGFLRGPFTRRTWQGIGYSLGSLPLAVTGFSFALALFSAGAGLAVTLLGLPVLAGLLAGARGLGAVERGRVRRLLGTDLAGPAPVEGSLMARMRDGAGWLAVLFQVLMFPWRVLSFVVTLTFLTTGWAVALLPAYSWVFPKYVDWPGYQLFDYTSGDGTHHAYYLESPFQIAGASLLGLVLVFLTPVLVRALNSVDRAAVRGLLGAR